MKPLQQIEPATGAPASTRRVSGNFSSLTVKLPMLRLPWHRPNLLVLIAVIQAAIVRADPQLTSWFTLHSDQLARIYPNNAAKAAGQTMTTWSNGRNVQAQPAYCGVQGIYSSSNWIYIRSTGLGSQVMGPWLNGNFPNLPTDQNYIYAIPRHPTEQTGNRFNRLGEIGMFVDGVRMFDASDAWSYSSAAGRDFGPGGGGGNGDRIWNRDAFLNESRTFDSAYAHQQQWGTYHYHAQPIALRYLLGDHVDFDPTTKTYHESKSAPAKHSPIIGWMQDGYPLYGPYGFSNPTNPASGIRRMVSSFALRDGNNGTDNVAVTGRKNLPAWAVRELRFDANQAGPNVSQIRPIGYYIEDYAYLGDCGKFLGKDFDLDELNGRWCVTPEFPQGTYAYFTTIDAGGKPIYPYNMGRRYHGNPVGQLVRKIGEPVVTNFIARNASPLKATAGAAKPASLTWNADGYEIK